MLYQIASDYLSISVNSFGAELSSIKDCRRGVEFLWQGVNHIWKKRSPVLFPIIGGLPDDQYYYKSNSYFLQLHGFAHSEEFILEKQETYKLIFTLLNNEKTMKQFPFQFKLELIYRVEHNILFINYKVYNTDKKPIHFMIGAHPGFNCPIESDISLSDYYLEFEKPETVKRYYLENGMVINCQKLFLQNQKNIPLNNNLFNDKAILLQQLKSKYISIKNKKNKNQINFDFSEFPYLALWSICGKVPFICIEPWSSMPAKINEKVEIEKSERFIHLKPGNIWQKGLKIIFDF